MVRYVTNTPDEPRSQCIAFVDFAKTFGLVWLGRGVLTIPRPSLTLRVFRSDRHRPNGIGLCRPSSGPLGLGPALAASGRRCSADRIGYHPHDVPLGSGTSNTSHGRSCGRKFAYCRLDSCSGHITQHCPSARGGGGGARSAPESWQGLRWEKHYPRLPKVALSKPDEVPRRSGNRALQGKVDTRPGTSARCVSSTKGRLLRAHQT